jgi:hypothetical protein
MAATLLIEYPLGTILPEIPAKSHLFYIPFTIKLFRQPDLEGDFLSETLRERR